jgi:hypothetical protein
MQENHSKNGIVDLVRDAIPLVIQRNVNILINEVIDHIFRIDIRKYKHNFNWYD